MLVPDAKRYDDLPGLADWLRGSGADHAVSTDPLVVALADAYAEPGRATGAPASSRCPPTGTTRAPRSTPSPRPTAAR